MATEITMPRLGQGMESGTVTRWLKSEGDSVEKGEPLFEVDTEKVTQEVEADVGGTVLRILVPEGTEIPVGGALCVIGKPGEAVEEKAAPEPAATEPVPAAAAPSPTQAEPAPAPAPVVAAVAAPAPRPGQGERIKASPLARRIARERGIDITAIAGTGPDGRIVAEDVERAAAGGPAPAAPAPAPAAVAVTPSGAVESVPLTSVRKLIAKRLSEAWTAPHFALTMSADMRRVVELRERLVEQAGEGAARPTYSDVLTKVCAVALLRHPDVNAHFAETEILRFPTADIGIAVAIPNGLVVPVIRGCERLTIPGIAAARVDLVERTRTNRLLPADMQGGTFTISNLGMYGIERFTAVLNPPQVAILAVGAIADAVVAEAGQPVVRPRMELTLSCDHRALDGATAAEFLRDLVQMLEEPGLAL